ncbi:MAG: ABC transporter substrate-binding protein [Acidimicrobiales bacterium]
MSDQRGGDHGDSGLTGSEGAAGTVGGADGGTGGISRRHFLEGAAGLAGLSVVAAACGSSSPGSGGSTTTAAPAGSSPPSAGGGSAAGSGAPPTTFLKPASKLSGSLSILQWSHFVPAYDKWFNPFAAAWGKQVGVNVKVDHISYADIVPRTASELAAKTGHDLIEWQDPPAQLEPGVVDLKDVNDEAVKRWGPQLAFAKASAFDPATGKYYGFTHSWVPDPGDYRKSLWEKVGMPNGPSDWAELLKGGKEIKDKLNVPMGIGMSNEIDSNMAARAMIWSFGGSIQDKSGKVVINSPETIDAVDYMVKLYKQTMTSEVFAWNAASNNQGLIAGQLSYILNSISAYRSAQAANPSVAKDVYFTPALKSASHKGLASQHVVLVYIIPKFSKNVDAAKEFLLNLSANEPSVSYHSKLYNFSAWPKNDPQVIKWVKKDPFGSQPDNKLALLATAKDWTTNIGYPGPANAAISEVFTTFVIPQMMAKAAQGKASPKQAVAEAETQIKKIFAKWRAKGLVG